MQNRLSASQLQVMINQSKFHRLFKPEVLDVNHDTSQLRIRMMMSDELERQPGTDQWHGGAISAIIDTVGCYTLTMISTELCPTINFRTDYLRPAVNTNLIVTGKLRRAGRNIGVVDVDVDDAAGRLIAVGRACYSTVKMHNER